MTKERKASASWYIAATHYLTAGFVVPFIANLVTIFLLTPIFGSGTLVTMTLTLIMYAVAVWLGVIYSARFLEKTYIIPDPKKVVNLATTYYVVLNTLFILGMLFVPTDAAPTEVVMQAVAGIALFAAVVAIVGATVFFVASRRFVKATV